MFGCFEYLGEEKIDFRHLIIRWNLPREWNGLKEAKV